MRWRVVAGSCGFLLKRKMRWRSSAGRVCRVGGLRVNGGGDGDMEGFGEGVADNDELE